MPQQQTIDDRSSRRMKTPLIIPWRYGLSRAQALPTADSIRLKKNGSRYGKKRPIARKRRG